MYFGSWDRITLRVQWLDYGIDTKLHLDRITLRGYTKLHWDKSTLNV